MIKINKFFKLTGFSFLMLITSCSYSQEERIEIKFLFLEDAKDCVVSYLDNFKYGYHSMYKRDYKIEDLYPAGWGYKGGFNKVVTLSMLDITVGRLSGNESLKASVDSIYTSCYPDKVQTSYNISPNANLNHIVDINTNKPIYLKVHEGQIKRWSYQ